MEETPRTKGVQSTAEWIDAVLKFAFGLAITVILAKSFNIKELDVQGVNVPLSYAWLVFSALTGAHIYLAVLFVQKARVLYFKEPESRQYAWTLLTENGPLFFRGMIPRYYSPKGFAAMSLKDITTQLTHAAALLSFVALFPWVPFGQLTWLSMVPAFAITGVNWIVGSQWAIAASELSRNDSPYFQTNSDNQVSKWQQGPKAHKGDKLEFFIPGNQ